MSLSLCEAKVRATNECAKATLYICLILDGLSALQPDQLAPIRNDNHACIDWAKSAATKGMKHLNLRKNFVHKSVVLKDIVISHVAGDMNVADLFTKELKDGFHFQAMHDSFMWPPLGRHALVA